MKLAWECSGRSTIVDAACKDDSFIEKFIDYIETGFR